MDYSIDFDGSPVCMNYDHQGVPLVRHPDRLVWFCRQCDGGWISDRVVAAARRRLMDAVR